MRHGMSADGGDEGTTLTRRRLLQYGGAGIASATLAGLHPWASAVASAAGLLDGQPSAWLRRSSYAGLAGQSFTAARDGEHQTLSLLAVSDLQRPGLAGADDAFALVFSGSASAAMGQGIRTLSHPALGTFDLFLAAVEQPSSEQAYELIVDRSVGAPAAESPAPPGSVGGSPQPVGGSPQPVGDSPQPVGGSPQPANGYPQPAGGSSQPAGGSPQPVHSGPATARAERQSSAGAHTPQSPHRGAHAVALRRASGGVLCEVTLAAGAHPRELQAWLMRDGHALGVATHRLHGAHRDVASFPLHTAQRPPAGDYEVAIIAIGDRGQRSSAKFPVTLR